MSLSHILKSSLPKLQILGYAIHISLEEGAVMGTRSTCVTPEALRGLFFLSPSLMR